MLRGLLGGYARGRRQTSSATLSLNFLAGINDSRITYSGGANGTRVNSAGVIVAATTPRFDYDPVTLAAKGLLVEEARTNVCLRSGDLSNAAWSTVGTLTVTGGAADPAGGTSGTTLDDTSAVAFGGRFQSFAVANDSATNTHSFFLKAGTAATSTVRLTYIGGTPLSYDATVTWASNTVAAGGSAVAADVSITPWAAGYYRVTVRGANNSTGNTTMQTIVFPAGVSAAANAGSCIAWGGQCELGSFPTSYIPTTTASVTRTADGAVMTGTNFSDWYNQSEGTFVAQVTQQIISGGVPTIYAADLAADSFGSRVIAFLNSSVPETRVTNTTEQATISLAGAITAGVPLKLAQAYKANDFASCKNGGTPGTGASGSVPFVDRLEIGSISGLSFFNGHIQSIAFYPRRLSNEQLQALAS